MRKFCRIAILCIVGLFAIALPGCEKGKTDPGHKRSRPPALVETAIAVMKKADSAIELVGVVRAIKQSMISAEVNGRVVSFDKREGDRLEIGEKVLFLDDTEYRLKLREAKGRLLKAEAETEKAVLNYKRISRLFEEGVVPEESKQNSALALKAQEAEMTLRHAEYSRAKRHVDLCKVVAPFSGYLATKKVDVGEWVDSGDALFEAIDIDRVEVVVEAPDVSLPLIEIGASALVTLDGYPNKTFEGAVVAISPKADLRTRSFLVKISVDNPDGLIKSGLVARARLTLKEMEEILMIPRDAVVWNGHQAVVFIADEKGEVRSVPVSLGKQRGEFIEAVAEFSAGQALIVTGNEILRDGAKVKVANSTKNK